MTAIADVPAMPEKSSRKWWTLAAVTASLFMVMVDTTIVNVALPAIQQDLRIDITELEWTVNAFLLVYAAFLLTGGKLADLLGRKRLFLFGLAVFTVSSLACGLADTGGILIGARAVQGLGAALMLPATQGLIAANFEPRERGMAYGIWAAVSMFGLSLGPLIGGLLIDGLDWRWIFYVNIPFGGAAFVFAAIILRESRDTSTEQRLDIAGLLTSGIALFALVFGLVEGNRYGWTSSTVIGAFGVTAVALMLFIVFEWRQRAPMLKLSLFRNRTFTGANVTGLLVMLALLGVLFFVSIYLQAVLGYSAVEAGAMFLPMTLLMMALSPVAGKLSDAIGPRWPITIGMTLLGVSLVLWSRLDLSSGFWDMLPGLAVGGAGLGLVMSPTTTAAIGSLPVGSAGVASGVVNTFRQTGGALGVAIMGAILVSSLGDLAPGTPEFAAAFIPGFQDALLLAAVISFAGAAFGAVMLQKPVSLEEREDHLPEAAMLAPVSLATDPEPIPDEEPA